MRNLTKAVALAAILAFPTVSFAGQAAATAPAKQTKSAAKTEKSEKAATKKVATKTATGTVKSVSDTQLVITKGSGKSAKDETFVVNASTTKTGTVETGSKVSVRYTSEGGTNTATAITASAPKAKAAGKSKKK